MLNVGDVVFGKFATEKGDVLRHYSVVIQANTDGALLAYTTSMKENIKTANPIQRFTKEDMQLAGFSKACLWDASQLSVVPASEIKKVGRVTRNTLQQIIAAYNRALKTKTLSMTMLNETGDVVFA